MSAVVILICVPTERYELQLLQGHAQGRGHLTDIDAPSAGSTSSPEKVQRRVSASSVAEYRSMEKAVLGVLAELRVATATWCRQEGGAGAGGGGRYVRVTLALEGPARCEEALAALRAHGVGRLHRSSLSVLPCAVHYAAAAPDADTAAGPGPVPVPGPGPDPRRQKDADAGAAGPPALQGARPDQPPGKECEQSTAWHRFLLSVRARLTVAEVVENVRSRAILTFDFICLLLIATVLCAIGLVENSIMYLLSSMLISPMMGPVMAGTFGSVIRDRRLQSIGAHSELVGLGIATAVGFCYGALVCLATDKYGEHDWPTYEMTSRGELRSLWVGCLVALLAGAAVALGVLSDNIASLVGVAISTSLMPPAVNAGLLWSVAAVYYVKHEPAKRYASLTRSSVYSANPLVEYLAMGAVSICLTFINIVCIYLAGILVFKIKEVAPIASRCHARKQFWRHDIRVARDYYRTIQSGEAASLYRTLPQEIDSFRRRHRLAGEPAGPCAPAGGRCQHTWSPCMHLQRTPHMREVAQMFRRLPPEPGPGPARARAAKELDFAAVGCSLQPEATQYRKLSQIFPVPTRSRTDLSVNASIDPASKPQATVKTTLQPPLKCAKKFVVTPSTYSTF